MGINWESLKKLKKDKIYSDTYAEGPNSRINTLRENSQTKKMLNESTAPQSTAKVTGLLTSSQTKEAQKYNSGNSLWDSIVKIANNFVSGGILGLKQSVNYFETSKEISMPT